jgi:hypothetical protein
VLCYYLLVDRDFDLVERASVRTLQPRVHLIMAVTPSISLLLCFSCLPPNYDRQLLFSSLGYGHYGLGLDVVIDIVFTRMNRALRDQLYWDRN